MRAALPVLDDAARSPDPSVCPFLRSEIDGVVATPVSAPDETNGCVAMGTPRPQSLRQQELVCLQATHADCPRYLRGTLLGDAPAAARRPATVPRATLAALLILVLSAGISFGFVLQRGGIDLPVVSSGPTQTAVAVAATPTLAPTPEATPSAEPTPTIEPTPTPTLEPTPTPTIEPTPSPTVAPSATPSPAPTPRKTAAPATGKYAYLVPCPDRPACYIYTVRRGNSMWSISNYFGIPLSTLYAWNPAYANGAGLRVGDQIRMPPPPR